MSHGKCLVVFGIFVASFFTNGVSTAQIFDEDDLSKQLQEQNIREVHLILGGVGQFFFPTTDEKFKELVRSRLPASGAQPVIVSQPALYLNIENNQQILSHNSLLDFLKRENRDSSGSNYRLLTFSDSTHLNQIEDFETKNFFELSDHVLFPDITRLNTEISYDKTKGIEEILADPSLDHYIKFLHKNKFKRIHITVFEGDQKTLKLLAKLIAYLKQAGAYEFERVSIAFYITGAGAGSTYLSSFPNLQKEIPWIEFLVGDITTENFVPLEESSLEQVIPVILKQNAPICNFYANCLLKKDLSHLSEERLGNYRYVADSLQNKSHPNLAPLFFSHGSFITFRKIAGSFGDIYKISFGDRFSPSFNMKLFLKMDDLSKMGEKPVLLNPYMDPNLEARQLIVPQLSSNHFSLILKTRFGDVEFPFEEVLKNFEEQSSEFWYLGVFRHVPLAYKDVFQLQMNEDIYSYLDMILDSKYPELRPLVDSLKSKIPSFLELLLKGTNNSRTIFKTAGISLLSSKKSCSETFDLGKKEVPSSKTSKVLIESFEAMRQNVMQYAFNLDVENKLRIQQHGSQLNSFQQ